MLLIAIFIIVLLLNTRESKKQRAADRNIVNSNSVYPSRESGDGSACPKTDNTPSGSTFLSTLDDLIYLN